MSPNPTRIKDIALEAGVSIGTVDRVLHNRGEVANETRERILRIADELQYSPNLMARALRTNKKQRLVALLPMVTDDSVFWQKHQSGLMDGMKQLEPYNVSLELVLFDMHHDNDFFVKAEEVMQFNPDGVLMAPIFKHESISFCQRLSKINIPFVFIDSFIDNSGYLCYIGEDAYQSGRVAAQLVDFATPVNKDVLVVNVAKDLENFHHFNNRTQGFLNFFLEKGSNQGSKISVEIKTPDFEQVTLSLDSVFKNNHNIGAVFVTSSKVHKIARYLEMMGQKDVVLVGYDIVEKNVLYLRNGYIHFLIGQRPDEQTEKGIIKLFDYLFSEKIPTMMEYLPIDVVTSENVDYYL